MYSNFRDEAKSTSLIGHENIVFVTDFGKCPTYGYYFGAMHVLRKALHGAILLDSTNQEYQETWVKQEKLAGLDDEQALQERVGRGLRRPRERSRERAG